ncbi:hypothetical protein HYFRA_00010614 [Hymenoscyphus fraxineus]|uniref:Uncharacterized protein n=1 Tax=Hymenoscyphus fraxineus TaxID=746836 RepID=A0A9N9L9G4_9HELO|nr:hypothetical protein HYFRA_00010614 [Hymenoscyphus fraxineus]
MDPQDPQQRGAPFAAYYESEPTDDDFPLFPLSGFANDGDPSSASSPPPSPSYQAMAHNNPGPSSNIGHPAHGRVPVSILPAPPVQERFGGAMNPISSNAFLVAPGMADNRVAPGSGQIAHPRSSTMAPANNFFAPSASPHEINYTIVGDIPDNWQDMSRLVGGLPLDGAQGFETPIMHPFTTHQWKAKPSIFDKLSKDALGLILDYVGATWNGEMPNLIIALRPSIIAYNNILEHFIDTNKFVLCPGNHWSLGGMHPQVIGRIKHLELSVCACNLTDGDNEWVIPEQTWGPTEKGLTSVETVTIYSSNAIKHLPNLTRYPASKIAHRCSSREDQYLIDFVKRYPIFLRPFDNLRGTTVHVCLTPLIRRNQLAQSDNLCRRTKAPADLHLRNHTTTVEYEVDGRTGLVGQKWVWKVADGMPGLNWHRIWRSLVPPHLQDISNLIDWSGGSDEAGQAAEQGQDTAMTL